MDSILKKDLEQIDILLEGIKNESLGFLNNLEEVPTSTSIPLTEIKQGRLQDNGIGAIAALEHFQERFKTSIVGSPGPRYWGYVTGGTTPAALMGDWLASVYDQNSQAIDGNGDVSARIELDTINLLLELFNLPKDYTGGFVTGATMSNFTCLATARQWFGHVLGLDVSKDGLYHVPKMNVLSTTPHSSSIKALSLLGLGSNNWVQVPTLGENREAMDVEALERILDKLDDTPFILISSAGTVNSGDFDDFVKIGQLRSKYNFWWHIDAAFGAFVSCSPNYSHLINGWDQADSITVDGHKWLNVPYESALFFIKEEHRRFQFETFQNSNAPYLGNSKKSFNYLNLLPENSRRLKALPAWFSLMAYGREGYRSIIESNISCAQKLEEYIRNNQHLELLTPVKLNIVSFTLKNQNNKIIDDFLHKLNAKGKVFMTPGNFKGRKGIRAALVNWRTSQNDIALAQKEIEITLKAIGLG